ncbi:hypothetical protein [Prolixibacter denitrificans]|uniref:Outer membrane protein with beta-barrel domain n=2 Tax=Prolixibacter denitrificans TaxID=1541063 RepID=A0A2P8CKB5_9BACT|nr:hypothetical protein [Prolixibacter denitrificans]PSK85401.1 hypothetical protein CLV93_101357 [Prolixibacter denitrificans]GET20021.1 hypothetical protein JCM18694_02670 [Prolixibacter denitrificans]
MEANGGEAELQKISFTTIKYVNMKLLLLLLTILLPLVSMAQEVKKEKANHGLFTMFGSSVLITTNNRLVSSKYADTFANAETQNQVPVSPNGNIYSGSQYEFDSMSGLGINVIAGWYITQKFSLGAGIGAQPNTVPVFLNGRYCLTNKANAPFLVTDVGIFTKLLHANSGHFYRLGGGYRIGLGKSQKTRLLLSLNYDRSLIKDGAYYWSGNDFNSMIAHYVDTHFNNLVFSVAIEL